MSELEPEPKDTRTLTLHAGTKTHPHFLTMHNYQFRQVASLPSIAVQLEG